MDYTILIAGLVGFAVFKLANYSARGKKSDYSPPHFDLKYWLSDRGNWNDLLFGFVVFFVIARYKDVLFTAFPENFMIKFLLPYKDSEFLFFAIGFLMTFILMLIRTLVDKISILVKAIKKEEK